MLNQKYPKLKKQCMQVVRNQGVTDPHEVEAISDDAILDLKSKGFELRKAKQLAIDHLRKKKLEISVYLDKTTDEGDEVLSWYDVMEYDDSVEINTALQAHQRQLIEELVSGSDERTTLIVRTWLESDNSTPHSVAKELSLDFNQVTRTLAKLRKSSVFCRERIESALTGEAIIAHTNIA